MLERIIWNVREEVDWLKYSVQPPLGILQGDYYRAEREFGGGGGVRGHIGSLEVVVDQGKIVFVEFNEQAMEAYYNQYFAGKDKRRSDYGIWQASKERQVKLGVALVDGMRFVEDQIIRSQTLSGDFDLLTGASGSMKNMLPMAKELAQEIGQPSGLRYYSIAEDFGYGLTGWLRVVTEGGKIVSCTYDEVFADHQKDIAYDELKRYYKQAKALSPCYEDPFPPGWDRHAWNINFATLMDMLGQRIVETQDLLAIDGLPYTEGEDFGPVWDGDPGQRPITNSGAVRYPAWNNYLRLARKLREVLPQSLSK